MTDQELQYLLGKPSLESGDEYVLANGWNKLIIDDTKSKILIIKYHRQGGNWL